MSLFSLRDVWSFPSPEVGNGGFCLNSLCLANIDNDPAGEEKIILGSESGILRIIGSPKKVENGSESVGSLLAEFHMGSPILQISVGYFVGGSSDNNLAILHPQKLGVYGFCKVEGQVEYGSQYKVTLLYEHKLRRHAFNMCVGPFGQVVSSSKPTGLPYELGPGKPRRDFICVQALDGTLSFFEQEVFAFSRYLPNFLLPGPIAFVPSSNSFLTINSSWELQSFRYASLVVAKDEGPRQTEDSTVGKRLSPDWFCSLGEEPLGGISVLQTEKDEALLIVLTFRLLFCFSAGGELLWSKRLEFSVSTSMSFINSMGECMTVVASSGEPVALYVYSGTALKWAAKLPFPTIALGRIRVGEVSGGLVALSDTGEIGVFVLGTEPSLFIAPPIQSRELDYEAAEKELVQLRKIISDAGEQNVSANRESRVDMKIEFEGQKTVWVESTGMEAIALIATVKILCRVRVNDVRVTISTSEPIICTKPSVYVGDIVGRHNYTIEFYAGNEAIPSDLECEVNLFYVSDTETPHCIQKIGVRIPLFIIAKPLKEIDKAGDAKLTLALNKSVLNLMTLYNDFDWKPELNEWGLSFLLKGGETVTILASTKGNTDLNSRYRLQSHSLAAINLILRDFLERLRRKFGRGKETFQLTLPGHEDEIPLLTEYFHEIDSHVLRRRRQRQIKEDVADRASQLRGVQRRLLIRFRDKNILPMTQLESLLEGSLEQILDALNFMDENESEKQKSESRLSGATRLILELCRLQSGCSPEDLSPLYNTLCPFVSNLSDETGWEECVYVGLSYLKAGETVPAPPLDQMDTTKLKKLIKSRVESLKKSPGSQATQKKNTRPPVPEVDLKGTEIVERMMSARSRTEKRRNPASLPSIPEPIGDIDANEELKQEAESELLVEAAVENEVKHAKDSSESTCDVITNNNNNVEDDSQEDGFW